MTTTALVTAPPTHLIPPNEAVGRVSQADIVNLLVVRHRAAKEALIAKIEEEINRLTDELNQDTRAIFDETRASVQRQVGRKLQRLNAAGKAFGLQFVMEERQPKVVTNTSVSYSGTPVFSPDALPKIAAVAADTSPMIFAPPAGAQPSELRWEQALLYWIRFPEELGTPWTIYAQIYLTVTRGEDIQANIPIKLDRPAACATIGRGLTLLHEQRQSLHRQRVELNNTADLTSKIHAQMTEHILRTGGVDIDEWLNKL